MLKKEKYTSYFNTIRSINYNITIYQAILVAHNMGLFNFIGKKEVEKNEIYRHYNTLEKSAVDVIISACMYHNLLEYNISKCVVLSECAKSTLLDNSECNMSMILDFWYKNDMNLKKMVKRFQKRDKNIVNLENQTKEEKENFIAKMNAKSFIPAMFFTDYIDLSGIKSFVDIGGGSGIFSIMVKKYWPHIECKIYEQKGVGIITKDYIEKAGYSTYIEIIEGDMFVDTLPCADIHFYSEIFHDWSPDECLSLAKRSYNILPKGGKIILFEMLFIDDDKSLPLNTIGQNITMQLFTNGQQFSKNDISDILKKSGFVDIKFTKTNTDYYLISALKAADEDVCLHG